MTTWFGLFIGSVRRQRQMSLEEVVQALKKNKVTKVNEKMLDELELGRYVYLEEKELRALAVALSIPEDPFWYLERIAVGEQIYGKDAPPIKRSRKTVLEEFSNVIAQGRKEKKLTLEMLSEALRRKSPEARLSTQFLSDLENGRRSAPGEQHLKPLSEILDIPFYYLCVLVGIIPSEVQEAASQMNPERVNKAFEKLFADLISLTDSSLH